MAKDVTLLTGFLGSGKTTLLNALMANRPQTRFALIENEYGEEGIDGQLVLRPDVDIVELSNGCICCSMNDDLLNVLEELYESFDLTGLYHRLMTLLLFQGQGIYRVKGIIYDATRNERWIIQSVGKNLTMLEGAAWAGDEQRISRILFIGKLLKPAGFEKMLRHCLAKEAVWHITNAATLLSTPTL